MKWIRYLVPLVLLTVVATAEAQWTTPSRYATTASGGASYPRTARVNRLIVADEPPPVAAGEETIIVHDEGVPCDDCAAPKACGHFGHKLWGCGCKTKKTCCAARSCAPSCWSPCGLSLPKISFGCDTCDAPATCDVCGSAPGCRPKWLHGCSACRPSLQCYLPKITWSSGKACDCQTGHPGIIGSEDALAPQPEPQATGEPIETPRAAPRVTPRPAPQAAPRPEPTPEPAVDPADPAAKSASLGWTSRNRTRTATTWAPPQPSYSRPATYEYRTR